MLPRKMNNSHSTIPEMFLLLDAFARHAAALGRIYAESKSTHNLNLRGPCFFGGGQPLRSVVGNYGTDSFSTHGA